VTNTYHGTGGQFVNGESRQPGGHGRGDLCGVRLDLGHTCRCNPGGDSPAGFPLVDTRAVADRGAETVSDSDTGANHLAAVPTRDTDGAASSARTSRPRAAGLG
jgi:hypothetical protein